LHRLNGPRTGGQHWPPPGTEPSRPLRGVDRGDYVAPPSPSTQQITFMVFNPGCQYRCGLRVDQTSTARPVMSPFAARWLDQAVARTSTDSPSVSAVAPVPPGRFDNRLQLVYNSIPAFLTGPYHVGLIQEWRYSTGLGQRDIDVQLSTMNVGITVSQIGSCCAIATSGGGESLVTILEDRIMQSPWAKNPKPGTWALSYLLARIDFGTLSDGSRRTRAGFNDIVVCSVHMDSDYAKKTDVTLAVLTDMFQRCLESKALYIGGDFNAAAYPRGTGPSLAVQALEEAKKLAGIACRYHERVEDCIVGFVIQYQRYVPQYKVAKSDLSSMTNEDLRLFPLDTDWHLPLMVTIRPLNDSVSTRKRSAEGEKDRKAAKRAKYRERHAP